MRHAQAYTKRRGGFLTSWIGALKNRLHILLIQR
jgi:hypothetical protein